MFQLIQLEEKDGAAILPPRVQLLRVGSFNSDQYGKLEITKEFLLSLKNNFDKNVRQYPDGKLPLDYFHESDKIAAGWISAVELDDKDGGSLWAAIDWTPSGKQKVLDKELRYLSADFHMNYKPNEGSQTFGPTLFGAGLTNRPFVKNMEPILKLSDKAKKFADEMQSCVSGLIPELIAQGHDQEQAIAIAYSKCGEKQLNEMKQKGTDKMTLEQAMAKIAELEAKIKEMQGGEIEMGKKVAQYEEKAKLAEKTNTFNTMLANGKAVEAQRESFIAGDMVKFAELAKTPNLNPAGGQGGDGGGATKDAQEQLIELADKKMKEGKITFSEAIMAVQRENPKLAEEYRKAVAV